MNVELIIQSLLAVGTIVGGIVAAIATYRSTNSAVRTQDAQIKLDAQRADKEIKSYSVEEAERISNISITNAQFMQQLLNEITQTKNMLQQERDQALAESNACKIKRMRLITKLRSIHNKHDVLLKENSLSCPAFIPIQNMLVELLAELEADLEV